MKNSSLLTATILLIANIFDIWWFFFLSLLHRAFLFPFHWFYADVCIFLFACYFVHSILFLHFHQNIRTNEKLLSNLCEWIFMLYWSKWADFWKLLSLKFHIQLNRFCRQIIFLLNWLAFKRLTSFFVVVVVVHFEIFKSILAKMEVMSRIIANPCWPLWRVLRAGARSKR